MVTAHEHGTLENHMLFITNSTTAGRRTDPVCPVYMTSISDIASSRE